MLAEPSNRWQILGVTTNDVVPFLASCPNIDACCRYIGPQFPRILVKPSVEYTQTNLTIPGGPYLPLALLPPFYLRYVAMVQAVFEPEEGQTPFDYVFDLTGEVRTERLEEVLMHFANYDHYWGDKIHVEHTFNISRLCALEAAKRKVKAYVRLQQPCYDCPEKGELERSNIGSAIWTLFSGMREEKDQCVQTISLLFT